MGQAQPYHACAQFLGCVPLFATPRTVAHQALLSMGIFWQEHWSGLPFPLPGDPPDSGIKPMSPALAGRFFTTEPPGKPSLVSYIGQSSYLSGPQFPYL